MPKSIRRFMDQVRALTGRRVPLKTKELIEELNPVLRVGDLTTSGPTFESSSTGSTVGWCGAFRASGPRPTLALAR